MPREPAKKSRGGARPGAGRKPLPKGERKKFSLLGLALAPEDAPIVSALTDAAKKAGESRSRFALKILAKALKIPIPHR